VHICLSVKFCQQYCFVNSGKGNHSWVSLEICLLWLKISVTWCQYYIIYISFCAWLRSKLGALMTTCVAYMVLGMWSKYRRLQMPTPFYRQHVRNSQRMTECSRYITTGTCTIRMGQLWINCQRAMHNSRYRSISRSWWKIINGLPCLSLVMVNVCFEVLWKLLHLITFFYKIVIPWFVLECDGC